MSTQYPIWQGERKEAFPHWVGPIVSFEVDERSSRFVVRAFDSMEQVSVTTDTLTAEELVVMAMKMIQPVFYNVPDSKKFFDEVLMREIGKLFV